MALPNTISGKATITNPNGDLDKFLYMVDLSNFPLEWWNAANSNDGARGRASKGSGVELATDWFLFNRVTKTGFVRVNWGGVVSALDEQFIYIYPPNTDNEIKGNTDAFGSNDAYNQANVLLYSPNGGNDDKSSNNLVLNENNFVVSGDSAGKFGDATSFNGTGDYLNASISDKNQPLTFMAWVNSAGTEDGSILGMDDGTNTNTISLGKSFGAGETLQMVVKDGTSGFFEASGALPGEVWAHTAGVFADTESLAAFINGDPRGSTTTATISPLIDQITIGGSFFGSNAGYFFGLLQEVFAFTDAKTADWIAYEYLQSSDNATFWGEWTIEPASGSSVDSFTFCTQAVKRLAEQFENKENITKYLCALMTPFDDLKKVFDDLQFKRSLDIAEGVQLDGLGEIIGLVRGSLSDTDYRFALNGQIIINASNGEVESIIAAMFVFVGGTFVQFIDQFPAAFALVSDGDIPPNIIQLLEQVTQAGVGIEVSATYGETALAFEGDSGDPVDPTTQGFSEPNYAPDDGLGGSLSEKFS